MAAVAATLESYVLAPDDEARSRILDSLVEGSEAWYELQLVERLRDGRVMDDETKDLLAKYRSHFPGEATDQLCLRAEFLRCGVLIQEKPQEQKTALTQLGRSTLNLDFSHRAPASCIGGSRSRGAAPDPQAERGLHELPVGVLPSRAEALNALYGGDSDLLGKLPNGVLKEYDFSKLPRNDDDCIDLIVRLSRRIPLQFVGDGEPSAEPLLLRLAKIIKQDTTPLSRILPLLTQAELERLAQDVPNLVAESSFVEALMLRKFPDARDPEAKSLLSRDQKRDLLQRLFEFVDLTQGPSQVGVGCMQGLRVQLMSELLQLGTELNHFDADLLLRYCREARRPEIRPGHSTTTTAPFFFDEAKLCVHRRLLEQPPVRAHLRGLILTQGFEEKVTPLLVAAEQGSEAQVKAELLQFRDEVRLLRGLALGRTDVTAEWLDELSKKASIDLVQHNPERFGPEEDIKLTLRIKNVPQMIARIYEISAENYYLHHQRAFSSDIDLDGIGATFEAEYNYSQAPLLEHDEELEFPQLSGKQGLFVIDFVGAGMRSRAVIRKGNLLLIHRTSPVGHVAYVLGPDRQIVKHGARLHLSGHWFESDPEKGGRIIIPFGKNQETSKVIISALGMSQFSSFERFKEQYDLQTAFSLFRETVVMGKSATLLIRPRLLCCGRLCNASLIKNAEVTVSMRSGSDSVPTVRTFNGFDWTSGDGKVEFLVPSRLKSIEASLRVEVASSAKGGARVGHGEVEVLTSKEVWSVQDHADDTAWFELYLSRTASGYEIQCLGKDGEPQPDVACSLMFDTALASIPHSLTLTTDARGAVHLGLLEDVEAITASAGGLGRRWVLPSLVGTQYPHALDIVEGEEIEFPCSASKACIVEVTRSGEPIRFHDVRIEASKLRIFGLNRGTYMLYMLNAPPIRIHVHRGNYWQDGYVLRHDAILENKARPNVIAFERAEAGAGRVSAKLTSAASGTRVHIFGFRFLPHNLLEVVERLKVVGQERIGTTSFPFQMWQNIFQSDVAMGDEMSYVLRRRKADTQIGNMLKKPSLLLVPHVLRETNFATEALAESQSFMLRPECMMRASMAPAMYQQACMPSCMARSCADIEPKARMRRKMAHGRDRDVHFDIQGFQNFLQADAFVAMNLAPSSDGNIECSAVGLEELVCVLLVAVDERAVAHSLVPIARPEATAPPSSRALSLAMGLEPSQFYIERRIAKSLETGESFLIADQASAEWRAVDSLERLFAFYRAVCPDVVAVLEDWRVTSWPSLTGAEKQSVWSKHICHEMNLFLRMKDPLFFSEVVQPFVQSKMEMGVVDWFLLGRADLLEPYLAPARFHELNVLEQVLVLYALAARHVVVCRALAGALRAQAEAAAKAAGAAVRRGVLLDSVLSLEQPTATSDWTLAQTAEEEDTRIMENAECRFAEEDRSGMLRKGRHARACSHGSEDGSYCSSNADEVLDQDRSRSRGSPSPPPMMAHAPMMAAARSVSGAHFDLDAMQVADVLSNRMPEPRAELEGTREYSEKTYHECCRSAGSPCFGLSYFWADVAEYAVCPEPRRKKMLSPNFVFATRSVHEVAAVLALIDLPFTAEQHALVSGGGISAGLESGASAGGLSASFDAASPCIFVAKEIAVVPKPNAGSDVSVAVRVYKAKLDETASQDPLAITEFLALEPYCLQVIVTNVSPRELEVQALVQIPQGAVPLGQSAYTQAHTQRIGAFACLRVTVPFYFPRPGDFKGAPVFCSVDGHSAALSTPVLYHVVRTLSSTEVETFADVVASGDDAVLQFLGNADLFGGEKGFSFSQLYPLLQRETLFTRVVPCLRDRGIFERTVWSYGFLHGELQACKELLSVERPLHQRLGSHFDCPLISVPPSTTGPGHLEYFPLVNKRTHRVGEAGSPPPILNRQLKETYQRFVRSLARKSATLDTNDKTQLSYYLLCQDRIQEARTMFEAAGGAGSFDVAGLMPVAVRLQRDYMASYFQLFDAQGDLAAVQLIAEQHSKCPHVAWRERFADLAALLEEVRAASQASDVGPVGPCTSANPAASGVEPSSASLGTVELRRGKLEIQAQGFDSIKVKLYRVDLEMLFSRAPFIKPELLQSEFSFVKPLFEKTMPGDTQIWEIPAEHRSSDLAVEVIGGKGSMRAFRMHFASTLRVAVAEREGCVTVSNASGRPLPAVYLKVFGRSGDLDQAQFFKDGYTDLRGRFDYATLSGERASRLQRFSILVASDDGGLVLEAAPPSRMS